jgi:hypothetical protein
MYYSLLALLTINGLVAALPQATSSSGTTGTTQKDGTPAQPWQIQVNTGSTTFQTGDVDPLSLAHFISDPCSAGFCDSGTPGDFTGHAVVSGYPDVLTGTMVMSGEWHYSPIGAALIRALQNAFVNSKKCTTVTETLCSGKRSLDERETPGIAQAYHQTTTQQCTVINTFEATAWSPGTPQTSANMGSIKLSASSKVDDSFDCSSVGDALDSMSAFGLPLVDEISPIVNVICGAIGGASG